MQVCTFLHEYASCVQGLRGFANPNLHNGALNLLEQCTAQLYFTPKDVSSEAAIEEFCSGMLRIALFWKDTERFQKGQPNDVTITSDPSTCPHPPPAHPSETLQTAHSQPLLQEKGKHVIAPC